MAKIHIVEPYHSKAMRLMSEPLMDLKSVHTMTMGDKPDPTADLNIHVPWHSILDAEPGGKHIIVYTHCNAGAGRSLAEACARADLVTVMSFAGRQELLNLGVDPKKIWVVYCGADQYPFKRRNIAIVAHRQESGRKREGLLMDLAWMMDSSSYEFLLAGGGWEAIAQLVRARGMNITVVGDLDSEKMLELYAAADLLLVTGYVEGGPLPLLEALSVGIPVLSPNVGFASDLLPEECIYTDVPDLIEKIEKLFKPVVNDHLFSTLYRWKDYVIEYGLIVGRLLGESVDVYPDFGMSRYAQLLDIIQYYRCSSICEIGTWAGDTAVRMIQEANKYSGKVSYTGFDLFYSQTGEMFAREMSKASWPIELISRRLKPTGACIQLVEGDTKELFCDQLPPDADLYFIDGGHSIETIYNDWLAVRDAMSPTSIVVFDDYYTPEQDGIGCNRIIDEIRETMSNDMDIDILPVKTENEKLGCKTAMAKVSYKDARLRLPLPRRA